MAVVTMLNSVPDLTYSTANRHYIMFLLYTNRKDGTEKTLKIINTDKVNTMLSFQHFY